MKWAMVTAHHVSQACDTLSRSKTPSPKSGGLVVIYRDHPLPAKAVIRLAYCLANNIPTDSHLKFSSRENTLTFLRALGFRAERLPTKDTSTTR